MLRPSLFALFLLAGTAGGASGQDAPARAVAVTFDDLPAVAVPASTRCNQEALAAFTASLLGVVREYAVPAVGFVVEANGACLGADGLAALLTRWLDAGAELGNHTYSHPSFDAVTVGEYTADIVRGETVTRGLLEARGQRLRYFRHPMLRSGADAAKKAALDAFLDERGYTVAPVTLDNDEWIYARAYSNALDQADTTLARRIGAAYLEHMQATIAFYERRSGEVLGYEPPQVLLLHANALNADYFGALAAWMRARGYAFVTLDEALRDPAYRQGNPYVGPRGISWIHRWADARGMAPPPPPPPHRWVRELTGY